MTPNPWFANLGVDATDPNGVVYRVIVGLRSEGEVASGYEVISPVPLESGLQLTIPGYAGTWHVGDVDSPADEDGYYHGSIGR